MTRASSWSNADGLVVGFGANTPELSGALTEEDNGIGGIKTASVKFDYSNLNAAAAVKYTIPAGSRVLDVRLVVQTGFTSTGTNTVAVGDATTAGGFITTTAATTVTMAAANAVVNCDGVYAFATTDATATEVKVYAAATDILVASAQTDWTAGSATLHVTFI